MLKLLLFAGIIYLVYRYYQRVTSQLKSGGNQDILDQFFRRQAPPAQKTNEGEFIDYEEVSSKKNERK